MKQSRKASLIESLVNVAAGFGISVAAQAIFLPLLGVPIPLTANLIFAVIMTAISIARSYLLRRLFEALHIRVPISPSVSAIAAERRRQREVEGWDDAHDDAHKPGELATAAACYALEVARRNLADAGNVVAVKAMADAIALLWPWQRKWWKPVDDRRDLIRSGALLVAELDRETRNRRRG